VEVTGVATTSV